MDARNARIRRWIETGEHVILTDYEPAPGDRSVSLPDDVDEGDAQSVPGDGSSPASSTASTASTPLAAKLVATDDDIFIPKQREVDAVFHKGRSLWSQLVASARSLPPTCLSAGLNDPSILLKDVPALPDDLPNRGMLFGRPLWHIPGEELGLQNIHGVRKHFCLNWPKPVEFQVSPEAAIGDDSYPPGLMLMTLCWSYIFSVRLWEHQRKQVKYTAHVLQPQHSRRGRKPRGNVRINLGASASRGLVRWLCALLAPRPGWSAQVGGFTPWTAFCSGGAEFSIITAEVTTCTPNDPAPSSAEAVELLIELASLYGLDFGEHKGDRHSPLSPIVAGFLAVLTLPLYRSLNIQPKFLEPTLKLNSAKVRPEPVRQYAADLRYYMTLSMHSGSVGSTIWSIFWHPGVECNLVSPWLSSALSVLHPLLDSGNFDILVKTFALHRPRVALWWLGAFLLGNSGFSNLIVRYLETTQERWGYGTMASPDPTVSCWTGSPQTFLDQQVSEAYPSLDDWVSRADLLRCRYNFRLQDTSRLLSWRPFGDIPKIEVEPDLWPWLERRSSRTYQHWIWYVKQGPKVVSRDVQKGFRKDTGRFVEDVEDFSGVMKSDGATERSPDTKLEPSRDATERMVCYCMQDMPGDNEVEISTFPGIMTHPWLEGSRLW